MEERDRILLSRLLGPAASEEDVTKAAEEIQKLAFREWMDWMAGDYRPTSIGQNNVDRIAQIYGAVVGDVPTVRDLVEHLTMPVGRARYMISVLNYETTSSFRKGAFRKLAGVLGDAIKGKSDEQVVTPFVKTSLEAILDEVEQEILFVDEDPDYTRSERLQGFRDIGREYAFTVRNARRVIEKLEGKMARL